MIETGQILILHLHLLRLHRACDKLRSDGLVVVTDASRDVCSADPTETATNQLAVLIKDIHKVMLLCNHAIYRSQVYGRPDGATYTYVRMTDVSSYLHKLLANDHLRDGVMRHFHMLEKFLAHPACEIIEQLKFNTDLIEVSNGFCFSILQRRFIISPIAPSMRGKIPPRAYVPYDCSTPPQPGYFRDAILNSFEDIVTRVNFLNKFYQCLLASKMPHKVRKLVVVGPRDSGKTSWANVFHRVVPRECIASVTNEGQFSAAMIREDTQLVIEDEWSSQMMTSHLAKTILQGGWMVTAIKHGEPRQVLNNSPYYITSNNVPDFGDQDQNVARRIQIFTTKSLPSTTTGMDKWIYDNAMHCIAWIAQELLEHHQHIASEELWYEEADPQDLTITASDATAPFQVDHIRQIGPADLRNDEDPDDIDLLQTIHERFARERRAQRLQRRRQRRRRTSPVSTADEDTQATPPSETTPTPAAAIHPESSSVCDQANPPVSEAATASVSTRGSDTELDAFPSEPSTSFAHVEKEASRPRSNRATTPVEAEENPIPQRPIDCPPEGWRINSNVYFSRVAQLIQHSFYKDVSKGRVHSYQERLRKARLRRTFSEKKFWEDPDPEIDASFLMLGEKRDIFNMEQFAEAYPQCSAHLRTLRTKANVRVMPDRCPFAKAVAALSEERGDVQQPVPEDEEVDSDGDPVRPPLTSQSYWTKIKNWRPW